MVTHGFFFLSFTKIKIIHHAKIYTLDLLITINQNNLFDNRSQMISRQKKLSRSDSMKPEVATSWLVATNLTLSDVPNVCHALFQVVPVKNEITFLSAALLVFAELFEDGDGVETVTNPLGDVTAGLQDSSGQQLPLQAVHVKCKLMDLLSQVGKGMRGFCFSGSTTRPSQFLSVSPPKVVIFQNYTNESTVPIEAKYVFPLGECAAVCGFEAFINGKHVVGQVTHL